MRTIGHTIQRSADAGMKDVTVGSGGLPQLPEEERPYRQEYPNLFFGRKSTVVGIMTNSGICEKYKLPTYRMGDLDVQAAAIPAKIIGGGTLESSMEQAARLSKEAKCTVLLGRGDGGLIAVREI